LPDSAVLLVTEDEARNIDVRNGDAHQIFPLPPEHLALRYVPAKVLADLAPYDASEAGMILIDLQRH
jgi:hypothetical protein